MVRPQNTKQETPSTPMPRRSGRILRAPDIFMFLGETYEVIPEGQESDPCTYDEAINDIDAVRCYERILLVYVLQQCLGTCRGA